MIVMNASQANSVRGPTKDGFALNPVALKSGVEWVLDERVLMADEHLSKRAILSTFTRRAVDPSEYIKGEE
jgi:hypothetical protein